MRVAILLNGGAGTAARHESSDLCERIEEIGRRLGLSVAVQSVPAERMRDAVERAAADRDVEAVVVGGGDGTLNTAANVMAAVAKPLGVLPLGTLNHFARDLGVPADLEEALGVVASGDVRPVDVGDVNGRVFLNNCSIGLYVDAVRQREALRAVHGWARWTAMARGAWAALRRFRVFHLTLHLPGGARRLRTPQLVVANNRYDTRLLALGRRARLDAGELWVYAARDRGRFAFLRLAWRALVGRLEEEQDFEAEATPEVAIHERRSGRRIFLATDGELDEARAPLRFSSRPGALRVFVPAARDADAAANGAPAGDGGDARPSAAAPA
jgi:diacylglycerol kinase family enzyme